LTRPELSECAPKNDSADVPVLRELESIHPFAVPSSDIYVKKYLEIDENLHAAKA